MRKNWKRFLSLLLVSVMALALAVTGYAAPDDETAGENEGIELEFEQLDSDSVDFGLPYAHKANTAGQDDYAADETVRVSIVLDGASAIDAGYAPQNAGAYRDGLKAQQDAVAAKISSEVLGGAALDVVWNITLAGNIISANVAYGKIEDIKNVIGVKDVVLETRYLPMDENDPNNATATEMTGANLAWAAGYTGAGSKVAIVDTGLDTDHELFDAAAFDKAIAEVNEERAEKNLGPVDLLTAEEVAAVAGELNIVKQRNLSADGFYLTTKVPFAANYVDNDLDVTHDNDGQGEHGSHVAGIAAANRYVTDDNGGFVESLTKVSTQGEAADAQIVVMKVFGKGGGAYDSDYMVAVEDAATLGCDSVNLSLGSANAGYSTNAVYAEMLDKLTRLGIVWVNSGGNSYEWATFSGQEYGMLYADDINYATGGSPGSYNNTLAVASVDNKGMTGMAITFSDGTVAIYTESSGYGNAPLVSIAGDYSYIAIDGPGTDEEWAALAEVLEGKIAVCSRGSTSFYQKANAAIANGAAAAIIYNNQPGTISMNLTGYEHTAPVVSITAAEGAKLKALGEAKTLGDAAYYEGTLTINTSPASSGVGTDTSKYQVMSDFSSTGVPSSLVLKPEITAPGGNIWSVNGAVAGGKGYEIMSGTSMAAPQVAGLVAVMGQYIRDNNLTEKTGLTTRQLTQSLLMSTARPLFDENTGYYWPVLKQGSGLADVNAAINARSYIRVTSLPQSAPSAAAASIADGKVKAELGVVGNNFTIGFNVTNMTDEEMAFDLNADLFTQLIFRDEGVRSSYASEIAGTAVTWTANGQEITVLGTALDFDGNGFSNINDAQRLLDYTTGMDVELFMMENADLDQDGEIDTADAYEAFKALRNVTLTIAPGATTAVTATFAYDMSQYDDVNGNYVEGYIFIGESDTTDGALGVTHSIPILGFYGNWSDASMFDRGSYAEYAYGFGDGDPDNYKVPYMTESTALGERAYEIETFLVKYAGDSSAYALGGNPMTDDTDAEGNTVYLPERTAINANDLISGVSFSQIRNAGASRFFVEDKHGKIVAEISGGPTYAAYYHVNQSVWRNFNTTITTNYSPKSLKEDENYTVKYQLAPEYYVNADGSVRWDELGKGTVLSVPVTVDNTAPFIVSVKRQDDTMIVKAHDNQYIAAVALWTEDGTLVGAYGGIDGLDRGEQLSYPFDLAEQFGEEIPDHLLVEVYDYAANRSVYKVNFNTEELENPVVEVTLDQTEATIVNKGSVKLTASVAPWGLEDETVTWSSSDESVVVVDENGLVTSVSSEDAEATVTATSNYDPTKSASCTVTVKILHQDLNGLVWDENGEVWLSKFDIGSLPAYEKLNPANLKNELCSAAYDENGTLYVTSLDSEEMLSTLYTLDTETFELNSVGDSSIAYMDICQAPSLGDNHLLAVYATYVVIVNKETGEYDGVFDMSSYTGGKYLVGIAYEEQYNHPSYGNTDWVFMLDEAGNIYNTGFLPYNGSYSRFGVSKIGQIGEAVDLYYWQSLYYDGANLFWSRFNEADNKVNLIMVNDLYNDGSIFELGSFADSVWPVGGLFELGMNPYFGEIQKQADHTDAVIEAEAEMGVRIPKIDAHPITKNVGGTNAVRETEKADPQSVSAEVTADIVADELTTNGLITVEYPDTVILKSYTVYSDYKSVMDEAGKLTVGHVTMDGIAEGSPILKLEFDSSSQGEVIITTKEINNKDKAEANLVEKLTLGSQFVSHEEHTYGEPEWTWNEDLSAASAKFTCEEGDDEVTVDAEIVITGEEGKLIYTASVEFEEKTYTDVKEVAVSLDKEELTVVAKESDNLALVNEAGEAVSVELTWLSSDEAIATVDETGAVTGVKPGRAVICAAIGETVIDECPVLVLFTDVADSSKFFYEHVYWALDNGVTAGKGATTFKPLDECSRGEVVTFLWRLYGSPKASVNPEFSDVEAGKFYADAVAWAVEQGITTGYAGTTEFRPNNTCTRGEVVTFLYRAAGEPEVSGKNDFSDTEEGKYYYDPVTWAVANGITTGYSGTTEFRPANKCTRGEIVTFLHRFALTNYYQGE